MRSPDATAFTVLTRFLNDFRLLRQSQVRTSDLEKVSASLECADLSALWPKRCQGTALQGGTDCFQAILGVTAILVY